MPTLCILDEITGAPPEARFEMEIDLEHITARDLIARRVRREVEDYNASKPDFFHGLVQPSDTERTLNGYKLKKPRDLDAEAQIPKACAAFEANGIILLVNDQQIETLEEEIPLTPKTQATFLKLTPLVGG